MGLMTIQKYENKGVSSHTPEKWYLSGIECPDCNKELDISSYYSFCGCEFKREIKCSHCGFTGEVCEMK